MEDVMEEKWKEFLLKFIYRPNLWLEDHENVRERFRIWRLRYPGLGKEDILADLSRTYKVDVVNLSRLADEVGFEW